MRRRASDNRQVVALPVFVPDPVGHQMFAGITEAATGPLRNSPPVVERSARWSGWMTDPQRMRGMASIGALRGRPVTGGKGRDLSDERSVELSNPALAVFAQRSARGQS
jgi:hypothetical protein